MKQTINRHDFVDAFNKVRPGQFSYCALDALFDYLTDLEGDTGEEIELDVIALCCDFCEFANLDEFEGQYEDEDDREDAFICELPNGGILARSI